MKKITAYIFILVANMVLLVHAVVPHHYHHSLVCIENIHDQHHDATNEQDCTTDHHKQDGNSAEICVLKQVIALPSNQFDLKNGLAKLSPDNFFTLIHSGTLLEIPILYQDSSVPVISSYCSTCLKTSFGLRAPPTV